ncbi:MAG: hypothetical protein IGR76_04140 [Synechococcales cyanobacterium T60_A2020_003]|nr:hypothetical protein [Synechococcales cyanobacterium T60_A2020_003]
MRQKPTEQLGFVATWSLAVGGMVGGGIYTALGVVVAVAVHWSWLSFLIAGGVALTAAYRYAFLANKFEQGGGAFEFLREIGQFVPNARVTVQIRLQSGDHDPLVLSDLTYKQVSDYHPLPAGRYTLKVQVGDQTLLQSTYGLAGSDRYTLTLYGILPDPIDPNPHTWMAQLKGVLGGVGAHAVNDYLPQMIVLHDRSSSRRSALRFASCILHQE